MGVPAETEALTSLSFMRESVTGWTSEVYEFCINHLYVVGVIVTVIVIMIMIHTLKNLHFVHKSKNYNITSTNEWFDWQEFEAYEKNRKTKT